MSDYDERTPALPSNPDAERALIGSVLSINRIEGRAEDVRPEDFSIQILGKIWGVMLEMAEHDEPIDIVTTISRLKGKGIIEETRAMEDFTRLIGDVPSSAHSESYSQSILEMGAKRKLAGVLPKIWELSHGNGKFDPADLFAEALAEIQIAGSDLPPVDRERWSAGELAALEIPDDPWMVDGLIVDGALNLIAGEFSAGKTFICLDLAIAAATGSLAWGREVTTATTLYFGADNSRSNLTRRIRSLCEGREIDPPHENLIFDISPLDLSSPSGMATIKSAINEYGAGLVIIDALIRYLGDLEENSAGDIGGMMAGFRSIANLTGCTFILVHHLRKLSPQLSRAKIADRVRGSGDFIGAVDSALVLSTTGQDQLFTRHMVQVKCREAEEVASMSFDILPGEETGTVITFGPGRIGQSTDTIGENMAVIMMTAMSKTPNVVFLKQDLIDELEAVQMLSKYSKRTVARAFSILTEMRTVRMGKHGRFNTYQWLGEEVD